VILEVRRSCVQSGDVEIFFAADSQGRVLLAVADEWCEWEPAATILPQLLAAGAVVEIDEADYQAVVNPPL
jgi:hypothetical protein